MNYLQQKLTACFDLSSNKAVTLYQQDRCFL